MSSRQLLVLKLEGRASMRERWFIIRKMTISTAWYSNNSRGRTVRTLPLSQTRTTYCQYAFPGYSVMARQKRKAETTRWTRMWNAVHPTTCQSHRTAQACRYEHLRPSGEHVLKFSYLEIDPKPLHDSKSSHVDRSQ